MAHGCERPLANTLTRILCCSAVSSTHGPAPNGGTGIPIGDCPWAWPTASNPGKKERGHAERGLHADLPGEGTRGHLSGGAMPSSVSYLVEYR